MATETSSIDDMLTGSTVQNSQHPAPEVYDEPESSNTEYEEESTAETLSTETHDEPETEDESDKTEPRELDDYGNEKAAARTYTEEEVNEMFRKRYKRGNQQQQPEQQQYQQPIQPTQQPSGQFEYNPDSGDNWQQQLEQFVEQTIDRRTQRQVSQQYQQQEQEAATQFRDKFERGMDKFSDFYEVVAQQPVDEAMTLALRGINDPASFIYAASKRHPTELQRIANLRDPYAKITEMGKLEERMRKTAAATKAPRPVGRSTEDAPVKFKEKGKGPDSEGYLEALIKQSENKKIALMRQKRGK
jgi:hypothetical protein